jgi:3D (Asp-Asp-Asp) domain-containing protein
VRIATYLAAGAAAWWFIAHPAPFPTPPAPVVIAADTSAADSTERADTVLTPVPTTRPAAPRLPAAIVPKGRLFRSIEERARAGERIAVSVTAYCLQGRTRRGNLVRDGIIAVDRKLFPLGREVDLFFGRRKYGRFLADDTGGVIKGGKIDVWMADCNAARRFGRRRGYAQLVGR